MGELLPCNMPCPKCGSNDVTRHFYARASSVKVIGLGYDQNPGPNRFVSGNGWNWWALRDFIRHTCGCCHYLWGTSPLPRRVAKQDAQKD